MQTEAEKYLIKILISLFQLFPAGAIRAINLGAAKSTIIEHAVLNGINAIQVNEGNFYCDRCDVDDCQVKVNYHCHSYQCSLEDMNKIPDKKYNLAFANFVLEHVSHPNLAAAEMNRILAPHAHLLISLSNPQAWEFKLAAHTPTSFHQLFRQENHDEAYTVKYSYKTIPNFINLMQKAGFELVEEKYFPATYSYLFRFPVINRLSLLYDSYLLKSKNKKRMGHSFLHFIKKTA